jgi:gamma-glutamylcyclotransferase (GGCT)/AIG2-like uncharacterized protein YtfP
MEPNSDENPKLPTKKIDPSPIVDPNVRHHEISSMSRKFLSGRAFEPPQDFDSVISFRPQYFFFYGSLMDPMQLRNVLYLEEPPILQPATITGWEIKMWDKYPALVFNHITHGMAYEVRKEEHVKYLTDYETEVYRVKGCMIKLAGGRELPGKTFIWNAGQELLKEGSFDLKEWQMEQLEKSLP